MQPSAANSDWGLSTVGTESWNRNLAQKNHAPLRKHLEKLLRRRGKGTKGAVVALSYTLWKNKMIRAMNINMLETQRSEPFHVLWQNLLPAVPQFVQCILEIPGVPENDHIHHKPERS